MNQPPITHSNTEYTFPTISPVPTARASNQSLPTQPLPNLVGEYIRLSKAPSGAPEARNQEPSFRCQVQRPESVRIWGTAFSRVDMQQAIDLADRVIQAGRPEYFVTANLNYLMLTDQHPRLAEVNDRCACILADGYPIVVRSRLEDAHLPCRVTGSDMVIELARLAAEKGYRMFFLGGAPGVAQAAANHLQGQFSALQVAGAYSPPFRALGEKEHSELIESIRTVKPDILLVAFGQPKGECWIYDHYIELGVPLSIQVGASFDFLAGTARRAPRFWQKIGCEWLYRALSDPKRLVPRYAQNSLFLGRILVRDLKQWIMRMAGKTVLKPASRSGHN